MSETKLLVRPNSVIHQFMTQNQRVSIWLEGDNNLRFDGKITGFDDFMNIVLEDAAEVHIKTKKRLDIGRILLKGDTIALVHAATA
jgi:small nuclear ribonucleoprotein E